MYPVNDYRDYLEHSAKGQEWGKHKYLYKTATGRYVYPEDVPENSRGGLSDVGQSRSGGAYGGSTRKFKAKKRTARVADAIKKVGNKSLKKSDSPMSSYGPYKSMQKKMFSRSFGWYTTNARKPLTSEERDEYWNQKSKRKEGKSISLRSSSPKSKTKYKYDRYKWRH